MFKINQFVSYWDIQSLQYFNKIIYLLPNDKYIYIYIRNFTIKIEIWELYIHFLNIVVIRDLLCMFNYDAERNFSF